MRFANHPTCTQEFASRSPSNSFYIGGPVLRLYQPHQSSRMPAFLRHQASTRYSQHLKKPKLFVDFKRKICPLPVGRDPLLKLLEYVDAKFLIIYGGPCLYKFNFPSFAPANLQAICTTCGVFFSADPLDHVFPG